MDEKHISERKSSVKTNHLKYLESCFDYVKDENELRDKHEERLELEINNHVANVEEGEEKEITI